MDLDAFFEPKAVAVFGSLREIPGTAFWVAKNMRRFGFRGRIHPINPNPSIYGSVLGSRIHARLGELPSPVDLAVVLTPPGTVPGILQECAQHGTRAVIILSEGFAERGTEGARLQAALVESARRDGVRIMGPNTFGVVNTANGLATIAPYLDQGPIRPGPVAVCGQTGSIGPHQTPLSDWRYPLGKMCDLGNKSDVDEADILDYLALDPFTKVIALHLEDVRDGTRFLEAARKLRGSKPLVVLKTGHTEAGAEACRAHTGALAGNDAILRGALRQAGAIRVRTWREFWEIPKMLVSQPPPAGNRLAVITLTGGQGVLATDAAEQAGLELAHFSDETVRALSRTSPRLARNPVDMGPVMSDSRSQAAQNPFFALEKTLPIVLNDPNVDCATITFYVGQQLAPMFPTLTEMFARTVRSIEKPVNLWIYGTSLAAMEQFARQLFEAGVPAYFDLEIAVRALGWAAFWAGGIAQGEPGCL